MRLSATDSGVQFAVRAQPKASRDAIVGLHGDALKIALVRSHTLGLGVGAFWEVTPLDSHGRSALELGFVTPDRGLVGASVRLFEGLSVGYGAVLGEGRPKFEPYASLHITF